MKIAVHGANWIGDAVMTIPALRELRRAFPDASITLYSRPWAKGVFQECDFIDDLVVSEPGDNVWKEAARWRALKFDAALLFTNSFRTALISRLAKIPVRSGFANEGRSFLLTNAVKRPFFENNPHEVLLYIFLAQEFEKNVQGTSTISDRDPDPRLSVSAERRESAKTLLLASGADPALPTIGFGVGSENSVAKRWTPSAYSKLIDLLNADPGANLVLLGSEGERADSLEVLKTANSRTIDLVGQTTLAEALAVISVCELFISNDMGLAHAASALGIKTLTIFGPTNPLTTRPWNGEIVRRDDVQCSPCMLRDCPIDHRCMKWIEASDVHQKAKSLLDI